MITRLFCIVLYSIYILNYMAMLKVGDRAPSFELPDQDGNLVNLDNVLSSFSALPADKAVNTVQTVNSVGARRVVLYFYPKDNTPGCTAEACSLRDGYSDLLKAGFVVYGVSADSADSHTRFRTSKHLPFSLLSDVDHRMMEAYGAWGMKKFLGREYMGIIRKTFVIAADGAIERIFDKVQTRDHFNQILNSYK